MQDTRNNLVKLNIYSLNTKKMRKIKHTQNLLLLFIIFLNLGCKKTVPPPTKGLYNGNFTSERKHTRAGFSWNDTEELTNYTCNITHSSKDSLVINGNTIYLNGENIEGALFLNTLSQPGAFNYGNFISIKGTWKKEKRKYILEGSYNSSYSITGGMGTIETINVNGTFKIIQP